jgi:hypothetical protein
VIVRTEIHSDHDLAVRGLIVLRWEMAGQDGP